MLFVGGETQAGKSRSRSKFAGNKAHGVINHVGFRHHSRLFVSRDCGNNGAPKSGECNNARVISTRLGPFHIRKVSWSPPLLLLPLPLLLTDQHRLHSPAEPMTSDPISPTCADLNQGQRVVILFCTVVAVVAATGRQAEALLEPPITMGIQALRVKSNQVIKQDEPR